jgi:nucleotide-binding universal stress UspA family protein
MLHGMTNPVLPDELRGALVVAVDDSPSARHALAFADRLGRGLGRTAQVVLVWNYVMGPAPYPRSETVVEREWQAAAEQKLQTIASDVLADTSGCRLHAVHGNTTATLIAVSRVAEQLVVGSRGRGGFAGLMLGSTSEQLVRHAACPVTVVPAKKVDVDR